jgi:hypothetical protein
VFNITNVTCQDNPPGQPREPDQGPAGRERPTRPGAAPRADRDSRLSPGRIRNAAELAFAVLSSWLAYIPRRLGDHLFAMNDTEAYWRGWQITKVHGGLGRSYRDPRFDTFSPCPDCQGTGALAGAGRPDAGRADALCAPCLGTGRISTGEVS